MKIVITGATGFIGKALCQELCEEHKVIALTRRPQEALGILPEKVEVVKWDAENFGGWMKHLEDSDAIVNLAGANVASGRWTKKLKERIYNSRIKASSVLVEGIRSIKTKPRLVIIASAIGFYGSRGDELLDEDSAKGSGFLSMVCEHVEGFAKEMEEMSIRTVVIRSGIVLDKSGGALARFMKMFRWYCGGIIGSGRQWISWISLSDEIAAIKFLIQNDNFKGVFNLVSPQPLQSSDFFRILASSLKKPCWLRIPERLLKAILGEMAEELFLTSQRVCPKRLVKAVFVFKYQNLIDAVNRQ